MTDKLSDLIKQARYGAAKNPYQGDDKKILFVCSMGILRSATAARLYARIYNTRAAGALDEALIQISPILCMWADEIVFVNRNAYEDTMQIPDMPTLVHDFKILDIPDMYPHMDPQLIKAFEEQYERIE